MNLPADFAWGQARLYNRRPIAEWQAAGIVQANGQALPVQSGRAAIILPQGARGPAFMVFDNFDVVMQWNRSVQYALSVALLADQFAGGLPLPARSDAEMLGRTQLMRLQQQLTELGFDAGGADGLPGLKTQSAIRRYQTAHALTADGYPTPMLAQHVRESHIAATLKGGLKSSGKAPTFDDAAP